MKTPTGPSPWSVYVALTQTPGIGSISQVTVTDQVIHTKCLRNQKESAVFVPPADVVLHGEVTDTFNQEM